VARKRKEWQFIPDWLPWDQALARLTYESEQEWVRRARHAAEQTDAEPQGADPSPATRDWRIRKAEVSDLEEMQAIARRTIDLCFRPFLGDSVDEFIDSGESDRQVQLNLKECDVLLERQAIAAFCVYRDDLIHLLMVDVVAQRRGIGSRLLEHAEEQLFARGNETLRVETFEGNEQAIRFYLKNGWSLVGKQEDVELGFTKVLFEKKA
jgi:ribosomal protein S18 acetylase RimI-like enzyme